MKRRATRQPGRRHLRPARAREPWTLSDAWQSWVIDNHGRGRSAASILAALQAHGVPAGLARREVAELLGQPAASLNARLWQRVRNLELLLRVRRDTWRARNNAGQIERIAGLDADAFFDLFYATNTPVIVTDMLDSWPALQRWALPQLKERYGDTPIEVMDGRNADQQCDRHFKRHQSSSTMAQLIERIEAEPGPTNDYYMVAHNRALQDSELRSMLDDIVLPELLDPDRLTGGSSLWLGPVGTLTPLHHDKNNILFCQVIGHKTVRLIAPHESALLTKLTSIYSPFDPRQFDTSEHPELADVQVEQAELLPGDALFIPIGWWHHVVANSASVSISFTCFRRSNDYRWYCPGIS